MRTTFEDRLLTELQGEMARTAGVRRRRRRVAAGVVGAVTVGLLTMDAWSTGSPWPVDRTDVQPAAAYRVFTDGADQVTVTIYRWDDAASLERQLRDAGVAAQVTYVPPGTTCRLPGGEPPAFRVAGAPELIFGADGDGLVTFTLRISELAGGTLVLRTTTELAPGGAGYGELVFGVVDGPVAPCELVASPDDALVVGPGAGPPR